MDQNTVDRHVEDWERIRNAVAFQFPDGDEVLIRKQVMCPGEVCGNPYALVLAEGTIISYAKRHAGCNVSEGEPGDGEH
jgi:hypothetical protein